LPSHNDLRLDVVHEIMHLVVPQGVLDKLQREEAVIRIFWNGQVEHALWVVLQECQLIIAVLTNGEVKFIDGGYCNKALDFDRDLRTIFSAAMSRSAPRSMYISMPPTWRDNGSCVMRHPSFSSARLTTSWKRSRAATLIHALSRCDDYHTTSPRRRRSWTTFIANRMAIGSCPRPVA